MQITNELVSYVANLSRIKLDENEISEMQSQMSEIVNYMDILNQLDTENVEPLSHIFSITNVMRDDEIHYDCTKEQLMMNAPEEENGFFKVPKIG